METHVKVLGVMFIVLGALGVLMALFLGLIFGTAGTIVGANAEPRDAAIALPFIGIAGTFAVAFLLALSLPGIITGIGLLKFAPWSRIGADTIPRRTIHSAACTSATLSSMPYSPMLPVPRTSSASDDSTLNARPITPRLPVPMCGCAGSRGRPRSATTTSSYW